MAEIEVIKAQIDRSREQKLKKYKCPLCGSEHLQLRSTIYCLTVLAAMAVKNVPDRELTPVEEIIHGKPVMEGEVKTGNGDMVRVADCLVCGYILMFRNGFGPE
jgi:hypothetical protein